MAQNAQPPIIPPKRAKRQRIKRDKQTVIRDILRYHALNPQDNTIDSVVKRFLAQDKDTIDAQRKLEIELQKLPGTGSRFLEGLVRRKGVSSNEFVDLLAKAKLPPRELEELIALDDWKTLLRRSQQASRDSYYPGSLASTLNSPYKSLTDSIDSYPKTTASTAFSDSMSRSQDWDLLLPDSNYMKSTAETAGFRNPLGSNGIPTMTTYGHVQPSEHIERSLDEYDLSHVNVDYICTVLCPELNCYRIPTAQSPSVGITSATAEYILNWGAGTNNAGMLYILPEDAVTNSCVYALTPTSVFNPTTGAVTVAAATNLNGPLYNVSNNIETYRMVSASVRVCPLVSDQQNAGNFKMCYFQQPPNATFAAGVTVPGTGAAVIAEADVSNYCFVVSGNMKALEYRMIHIPEDPSTQVFGTTAPGGFYYEGFYILADALTVTNPLKAVLTVVYEFYPVSTSSALIDLSSAKPGVASYAYLTALLKMFPDAQSWSTKKAADFCNRLRSSGTSEYSRLMRVAHSILCN